jgi:hypothetical protein
VGISGRNVGWLGVGLALIVGALIVRGAFKERPPSGSSAAPVTPAAPARGAASDSRPSGETTPQAPTQAGPDLAQLATVALYSCHAPSDPPAPPDGASAPKSAMIASMHETSKYNDEMNQYLDCLKTTSANLEAQYRGAAVDELREVDALATRLNNDAVDRLQLKVNAFNGELAKYKARSTP